MMMGGKREGDSRSNNLDPSDAISAGRGKSTDPNMRRGGDQGSHYNGDRTINSRGGDISTLAVHQKKRSQSTNKDQEIRSKKFTDLIGDFK